MTYQGRRLVKIIHKYKRRNQHFDSTGISNECIWNLLLIDKQLTYHENRVTALYMTKMYNLDKYPIYMFKVHNSVYKYEYFCTILFHNGSDLHGITLRHTDNSAYRISSISSDTSYRYRHSGYFCWNAHFRSGHIPCNECNRFICLAEDIINSMNFWYRYTEGQIYFIFLVIHCFISLFNSARLLSLSSWISQCMRRQHTCICTVQRMRKSLFQRIQALQSKISILIADIDRYRLYVIARITFHKFNYFMLHYLHSWI